MNRKFKGERKEGKRMTKPKPLPRTFEWARMDTLSISRDIQKLAREILMSSLDEASIMKRVGMILGRAGEIETKMLIVKSEAEKILHDATRGE